MGFLSGLKSGLAAINPWAAGAQLLDTGMEYAAAEKDRASQEARAKTANDMAATEALKNREMQYDFAKNGIRWRVDDAVAAGLSPLAALGSSTIGASPVVSVFDQGPAASSAGNKFRAFAQMGQNISRAAMASAESAERAIRVRESEALIGKYNAERDLATAQALESNRRMNQPNNPPIPSHIRIQNPDGSYSTINNPDIAAAIMSDPIGMWSTSAQNTFGPYVRGLGAARRAIFAPDIRGSRYRERQGEFYRQGGHP